MERKILRANRWSPASGSSTGKKVYQAITRGLFNFTDREGGGRRLVNDAPVLIELDPQKPCRCAIPRSSRFADRRTGVGLYAFVEADQVALEKQLRSELAVGQGRQAAGAYPGGPRTAAR